MDLADRVAARQNLLGQPLDMEFDKLIMSRLRRLAKTMDLGTAFVDCLSRKEIRIMEALIGRTGKSKKHAAGELEKKADLAFFERMKKRKPTDPTKLISHEALKKSLGL